MAPSMKFCIFLLEILLLASDCATLRLKMHSFNRPLGKTVEEVEKVATKLETEKKEKENLGGESESAVYDVSKEVTKVKKKIPRKLCQFFKNDQLRFEWCEFETPLKASFETIRAFLRNVGQRSEAVDAVFTDTRNALVREPCDVADPQPTTFDFQIGEVQYKLNKLKHFLKIMSKQHSVDDSIEIEEVKTLCLKVEKERKELKKIFEKLVDFWRTIDPDKINYLKRFWAYDGEKYVRKHYIYCANYYGLNSGLKLCYKINKIDQKESKLQSKLQSEKPHINMKGVTRPANMPPVLKPENKSVIPVKETDGYLR